MQSLNEMYLSALTNGLSPMPWVLDECNDMRVCVKDSRGDSIYFQDFSGISDEYGQATRELVVERSKLFAQWLVAFSNDRADA